MLSVCPGILTAICLDLDPRVLHTRSPPSPGQMGSVLSHAEKSTHTVREQFSRRQGYAYSNSLLAICIYSLLDTHSLSTRARLQVSAPLGFANPIPLRGYAAGFLVRRNEYILPQAFVVTRGRWRLLENSIGLSTQHPLHLTLTALSVGKCL